ncbi:MAG: hypothetical protein AAB884_00940, partial [Patescibacteria group bacterium]
KKKNPSKKTFSLDWIWLSAIMLEAPKGGEMYFTPHEEERKRTMRKHKVALTYCGGYTTS